MVPGSAAAYHPDCRSSATSARRGCGNAGQIPGGLSSAIRTPDQCHLPEHAGIPTVASNPTHSQIAPALGRTSGRAAAPRCVTQRQHRHHCTAIALRRSAPAARYPSREDFQIRKDPSARKFRHLQRDERRVDSVRERRVWRQVADPARSWAAVCSSSAVKSSSKAAIAGPGLPTRRPRPASRRTRPPHTPPTSSTSPPLSPGDLRCQPSSARLPAPNGTEEVR